MAEEIGSLHINLSVSSAEFKAGMKDVSNRLKIAQSEFKLAGAGIKDFGKSMDGLKAKSKYLEDTLKSQQEKVDFLRQRYEQLKSTQGENAAATQRMQVAYNNAQAAMRTTQSRLEDVNGQITLQSSRWHQLGEQLTEAGDKFKAVGDKMKGIGEGMSKYVTAPILAVGAAGLLAFGQVDEALDTIITKTGATGKTADKLAENFRNVASKVPDDLLAVGEAIGEVNTQFGFMGKELEDNSQLMLQFASINKQDVSSSALAAKQSIEAYGLENKDLAIVLDSVTKTSQKTGQATSDLFGKVIAGAPQIKALGLSFAEGTALIGNFEKSGVDSSAALSSLSKATVTFAKDGKTLKDGLAETIDKIVNAKSETEALTDASVVFGTKGASRMVDAIKRGTFSFDEFAKAGKEAAGSTKKTFEATIDPIDQAAIAANNAKLALADVGNEVQIALLPVFKKVTEKLKEGSEWFRNLSDESKKNILVWGGIAAAIGPVLVIGGTLIGSIGTIITTVGAASTAIAGAGGLVATLGALSGPIGLTIVGVGLVTAAVLAFTKSSKENNVVSFETLKARQKVIDKNDELIKNFDALNIKNQLSNSEMGRFLDINSELASTASPERIAALKDEQAKLLEKSTLTNGEMKDFLGYNDEIIKKAPNTETAISAQGKAFATNTFELQKVNAEKLHGLKIDAEMAINNSLGKENDLLKDQKKIREEIIAKEELHKETYANINNLSIDIIAKEKEVNRLKSDRSLQGQEILAQAQTELGTLEKQKTAEETKLGLTLGEIDARQTSLGVIDKDLKKLDETKFKYESIILATVGLTSERGKGLATIQTEISKLEQEKSQLRDLHSSGQLNTAEYNEQIGAIDGQIGKLQGAETELQNINQTAGKTVYKSVVINGATTQYADELNRLLQKPISKTVSVTYPQGYGRNVQAYAKGTRNAPGGLSWVGENGPELTYLPRGAKVIPNRQSEQLLRSWNIPMLASGGEALASGLALVGERGRELVGATTKPLSGSSNQSNEMGSLVSAIEKLAGRPIQLIVDGEEIARASFNGVNNINHSNFQTKLIVNGVR
jgi:TP901 family phage tail tape measure protein